MTLAEFLEMPKGVDIAEWDKIIRRRKYLMARVRTVKGKIDFILDALNILTKDEDRERREKKKAELAKANLQLADLLKKLNEITQKE